MREEESTFGAQPQHLDRLIALGLEDNAEEAAGSAGPQMEGLGGWVGRYKLLQVLGEGGIGVVYLAEQTEPVRRQVALKIIKPGMDSRRVLARFEAEAQTLARMEHPNIARVYDAGLAPSGRPYFVMEHVPGLPIAKYCDEHRLTIDERLHLFLHVCAAVQHAHQKGIIHRDLKPSNILVRTQEREVVAKVIDFGIARAIHQPLTERTLYTEQGQPIGTPEYMSPEQAGLAPSDVDIRTDIYSLGVLLYELLTGCTPFDAEELRRKGYGEMLRIICEQDPVKPSTRLTMLGGKLEEIAERRHATTDQLRKLVRGDLDWIVMKCLEKERTRRYETANGLVIDIEHHLNNEPVTARPPSRLYRFRKLVQRNKEVSAAVAVVVGLLCTIGLLAAGLVSKRPSVPLSKELRLVVLPFENRGPAEDEYFATGLTDAVTARLAALHGLAVISRQSAMQYKKGQKTTRQIAAELRVDYIL